MNRHLRLRQTESRLPAKVPSPDPMDRGRRPEAPGEGPSWRLPAEHSGNGILTAETAPAFRAAAARKSSNSRPETDTPSANPRKCRGPSQTRKIAEFTRTGWWRTQSLETSLWWSEFPANREKNRENFKNWVFESKSEVE